MSRKRGGASQGGLSVPVKLKALQPQPKQWPWPKSTVGLTGGGSATEYTFKEVLPGNITVTAQLPGSLNETTAKLFGAALTTSQYAELMNAPPGSSLTVWPAPDAIEIVATYPQHQGESVLKFGVDKDGKLAVEEQLCAEWPTQPGLTPASLVETLHANHLHATPAVPPAMPPTNTTTTIGQDLTKSRQLGQTEPPPSGRYPGYAEWGKEDAPGHQWACDNFEQWKQSLSSEEADSCITYTTEWAYRQINAYCRGETALWDGTPLNESFVRQQLPLLDQAVEKGEVPVNLVVYRGERFGFAERYLKAYYSGKLAQAKEKGQPLTYRNFLSTTITLDNFAADHFDSHKVRLVIKVPQGTRAGYLSTVAWESERELLLPRCSRLKIDDFGMDGQGRLNVECTYLPPRKDLPLMTGKEFKAYLDTKAANTKSSDKTWDSGKSKKDGKDYNGSSKNQNTQKGAGGG